MIDESNRSKNPAPLSLYLHLPFCERLCYFCGCTVMITGKNHQQEDSYLSVLLSEIDWLSSRISPERNVVQLHLGGGTPTYYTPEQLEALATGCGSVPLAPDAELAVEVDPRVTTPEHLDVLAKLGFNRLSIGVQDLTRKCRRRSTASSRSSRRAARRAGAATSASAASTST